MKTILPTQTKSKEQVPAFNEDDLIQSICRESFYEFVREFWYEVIAEDPVWNWHIKYLCDELQTMAERVFLNLPKLYDLIINISPGSTKSTIASIMFPAWVWVRMPSARVISTSFEHKLALRFSRKSRDLILCEKFQRVFRFKKDDNGRFYPSTEPDAQPITLLDDQNTKGLYENEHKGERIAVGSGGNITGSHGHFILVDDPINPKKAISEATLKEINRWMSETLPSRKVDKEVAPTILIMQRLHQDDPTANMLKKAKERGKIKHICLPAELVEGVEVKPARLRKKYVDGLMDPIRLSRAILAEARADLGEYGYAGQFHQNPVPLGGGMFKVENMQFGPRPLPVNLVQIVRFWDKAGTKDAGAYTAGPCLARDNAGRFWILDMVRGQWSSYIREQTIIRTAEKDEITFGSKLAFLIGIEQEPGSGGKESAENTVARLAGYRVRVDRPTGDKALRADPFSVQVNAGNVWVPVGADFWPALENEMRFFPFSTYKDQIDSLAAGFAIINAKKRRAGAM